MNKLIIISFLMISLVAGGQNFKNVKVTYEKIGDGLYDFYAENPNFYPMQISLDFEKFENMSADCKLPFITTLKHGKNYLFKVKRTLLDIPGAFEHKFQTRLGAYPVNYDPNTVYSLPIGKGKETSIFNFDLTKSDDPSRILWAFSLNKGDTVFCCREGVVCMKTETTYQNGYRAGENSITILHSDKSFAKYEVFSDSMVFVGVGDSVKVGTAMGIAGGDNYQVGTHVRFSVYYADARIDSIINNKIRNYYKWVQPLFKTGDSEPFNLKQGDFYINN
ncbi:MAG: peptidoglycan DD-metalloendopeptidase family protein [Prolixibacteraceae bacterium]|nr:peptidoglycan DD-metalloendopeptidase family protein [Prolixibacteraceae bacterium]